MQNLTRIIGKAPSELSDEELDEKLRKERVRVTTALDNFKQAPLKKKSATRKSKKPEAKVLAACKALNISVEEFLEMKKELEEEKKGE